MGYSIFRFGSLYLEGNIQNIPQKPKEHGDISSYKMAPHTHPNIPQMSIGPTSVSNKKVISWVKPDGINLLVADRVLLAVVSWQDLNDLGFVVGRKTVIDGYTFLCRLLEVGASEADSNEWDDILTATSERNSLWHWDDIFFWGADASVYGAPGRAVRGYFSARYWNYDYATSRHVDVGFRPALEPLPSDDPTPNINLDGVDFQLTSLPGGKGFSPILQPIQENVFKDIPVGGKVRMYTFTENGRPIHMDKPVKDPAMLTLTDRYYGDEFLIPWTISNGVAVVSQSLKQQI